MKTIQAPVLPVRPLHQRIIKGIRNDYVGDEVAAGYRLGSLVATLSIHIVYPELMLSSNTSSNDMNAGMA